MQTKLKDTLYCGVNAKRIKRAKPELDEEVLNTLFHWIRERYTIHIEKDLRGKRGKLTEDPILASYRFTNVRREHDKNTRWLIQNVSNNEDLSYYNKVMNTILFRLFSKYETMRIIHAPLDFYNTKAIDNAIRAGNNYIGQHPDYSPFTGSFMSSGFILVCKRRFPEAPNAFSAVMEFLRWMDRQNIFTEINQADTQQEVFQIFADIKGLGRFLGYQIFVDLTYIEEFPFSENEFTVAGLGCVNGLKRLFINRGGMNWEECLFWLRDNWEFLNDRVKPENKLGRLDLEDLMIDVPINERYMNVMSLENCFCELFKYTKSQRGEGTPRKKYVTK